MCNEKANDDWILMTIIVCMLFFLPLRLPAHPNRLDQILGKQGSKSKDVYASKISLASRVVKIERQVSWFKLKLSCKLFHSSVKLIHHPSLRSFHLQVDDIETKVDTFIELYMQDRKRLLSLPLHPDTSHSNNPNLPSLPPKGGGAAAVITSVTSSSSGSLKVSI